MTAKLLIISEADRRLIGNRKLEHSLFVVFLQKSCNNELNCTNTLGAIFLEDPHAFSHLALTLARDLF